MYQGDNRQYHFGYDRSTHTFYYVGTDTEVNPYEIIFGKGEDSEKIQGLERNEALAVSLTGSQIPTNIIGGGFSEAERIQPRVSTWIKGAKGFSRLSRTLSILSISYDFASGTANTSTLVNAFITGAGYATITIVGISAAPWVAVAGAGYGIFSIAGGDEWINSQIDLSDEINIVGE